jgi:hypothetical protein
LITIGKLQKKILSFVQVEGHTGEIMAKTVKNCLNDWELSRVLSVTVDNATSNDVGIQHLKRWLMSQNGLVLNGEYLHTRCCAHILNLIVKDGLAEVDNSILRVRAAVRYVRRTPSRFGRFKKCIDHETIGYKGYVGNDCETRWNSTYKMLKAALIHKMTFMELEFNDQIYVDELNSNKGVPTLEDWERVELILPFLSIFHEATMRMSGSSYLTSNLYMLEVFSVGRKIINMCNSEDEKLKSMALKMKMKYDKYWGNPDRLNMLLLIAMVLDPQSKMKLVVWLATRIYGSAQAESLETKLDAYLKSMYDEYSGRVVSRLGSSSNLASASNGYGDPHQIAEFYESEQYSTSETEIAKYNRLDVEERRPDFDVLEWWKVNSSRFPILASIARDVLAIPITTVASESTFSTGGRILDPYRSSLSVATVEALICTQDWLGAAFPSFITDEDLDTIDQIEEGKIAFHPFLTSVLLD